MSLFPKKVACSFKLSVHYRRYINVVFKTFVCTQFDVLTLLKQVHESVLVKISRLWKCGCVSVWIIFEPQTPLFPPPYVNLVNKKDLWKIGESEHNTDCDVTVRITNSYVPNICIYPPMFYVLCQPNNQKFCRYCEETSEDNSENGRSWK